MKQEDKKDAGRFWEGVPVVEATAELRVFASKEDIEGAQTKNWGECVFARACRRLFGSKRVAFFRTYAYIELTNEEGKSRVERFQMPAKMREQIEHFDKTGEAPVSGFVLKPVSESCRLGAKRKFNSGYKDPRRNRNKAVVLGKQRKNPIVLEWRSGTGMVHFNSESPINDAKTDSR